MKDGTRRDLHRLLDRVIDGGSWDQFWFLGYGDDADIKVKVGNVTFEEKRPLVSFEDAVTRAMDALREWDNE